MSERERAHRRHDQPELDTADFTAAQANRVQAWAAKAEQLARMDELYQLATAGREQHMHSIAEVQLYIIGRLATLAFGIEPPEGGTDE